MEGESKPAESHCPSLYRTPITERFEKDDKGYLGGGSFGTVYRGYDNQQQRAIAIKCIDRNIVNQWNKATTREVNIMSALQHPNIIQFYGCHEDYHDGLFMFLELCCPDNLNTRIIAKLKEDQALKWFGQLVEGMSYMNRKEYFHRDLKPQNLLISLEGQLKIADFGIARKIGMGQSQLNHSVMVGTPLYAAPEIIIWADGKYNEKCDVYSAGSILYEMLTSERLLSWESSKIENMEIRNLLMLKMNEGGWKIDHPAIRDKPRWMQLLAGMLHFDPQKRMSFQEVKAFLQGDMHSSAIRPVQRSTEEQQQFKSASYREQVTTYIKLQLQPQKSLLSVLSVLQSIEAEGCLLEWMPKVYRLVVLFLCGGWYCKLNNNLNDDINQRYTNMKVNNVLFKTMFEKCTLEDKQQLTLWLDTTAVRLNSNKENVKSFMARSITPSIEHILKTEDCQLEKQVLREVPELMGIHRNLKDRRASTEMQYQMAMQHIVNNLYQTDAEIHSMDQLELQLLCVLTISGKSKRLFVGQGSNQPPSYPSLKQMPREQLISQVKQLKKA